MWPLAIDLYCVCTKTRLGGGCRNSYAPRLCTKTHDACTPRRVLVEGGGIPMLQDYAPRRTTRYSQTRLGGPEDLLGPAQAGRLGVF